MRDQEILDLGPLVRDITADNAALLLWATMPRLPLALQVIEAWGFRHSTTAFTWVKTNSRAGTPFIGPGYYTASNAEICLLGVRGRMKPIKRLVSSVIISPRREHSRKPDEARERIVEVFGDLPRLEMFCRHPAAGWDATGNHIDGEDIRDSLSRIARP
jgi:site-specific DNA-methyltransferase (adenine-specific)